MPFAYIMGVEWDDSFKVAELLGTKTFLNEFIAYENLAKLIQNRLDGEQDHISVSNKSIFLCSGFNNVKRKSNLEQTNISQDQTSRLGILFDKSN